MSRFKRCQCRACGETLEVGTEWAGRKIQCPVCRGTTTVFFTDRKNASETHPPGKGLFGEVFLFVAGGLLLLVVAVCSYFLLQFRTERDNTRLAIARMAEEKARADKVLSEAKGELEQLRAENRELKLTARYYFDKAVEAMNAADTAKNNQADHAAIARFREVIRRFPGDPLSDAAQQRINALVKRIFERDAAVEKAQSEVVALLRQCRNDAAMAKQIRTRALRFNVFNDLDPNSASAGNREAEPYDKAAKASRDKARELLRTVPDPDGMLAKQVDECDNP
ncbi:MAG: hypothetical protein HY897_04265 [Deltaproteobacteria bacterium]|nr:hypothetical protein [Deltaproteobacteria bacterium]